MRFGPGWFAAGWVLLLCCVSPALGNDIPKAAWKRPIGQPLANAGTSKPALGPGHIDDGYWQGAPVGGFGAGTFSRSYRGDFSRWHLQPGVHKFETEYANQFAMFQKAEDETSGVAKVLFTGHPEGNSLKSWSWDYPVGAGDYAALYPKSWFDYRWEKFPAHVTLEQFSPVLPDNYKETSYPVAVYRWHAENPTKKKITVSVLLSWTNMLGWMRGYGRDFRAGLNEGNFNRYNSEHLGDEMMKGVMFERNRGGKELNAWDGQMTVAALQSLGVEVTYVTTYSPQGDGSEVWNSFAKDGSLSNTDAPWLSSGKIHAGAWREENYSHGHRMGLAGDRIWFRTKVESALHGFLREERRECVGHRARWTAECKKVE
jgi:non-lysosomal glucosylceramidase